MWVCQSCVNTWVSMNYFHSPDPNTSRFPWKANFPKGHVSIHETLHAFTLISINQTGQTKLCSKYASHVDLCIHCIIDWADGPGVASIIVHGCCWLLLAHLVLSRIKLKLPTSIHILIAHFRVNTVLLLDWKRFSFLCKWIKPIEVVTSQFLPKCSLVTF